MTEQTREQELHQIIKELFQIVDHSTLNIAVWPRYDALQARYRGLMAEQPEQESGIRIPPGHSVSSALKPKV